MQELFASWSTMEQLLIQKALNVEKIKHIYMRNGTFEGCMRRLFERTSSRFLCMKCDILFQQLEKM